MVYRNLAYMENGIKPVWVFDGKPPVNKQKEVEARQKLKKEAQEAKANAKASGDAKEEVKQAKRGLRITQAMMDEAKELLKILGLPIIQAKSEAEAQCAALNKSGVVFGVATEDSDVLVYGAKTLLKKFKNNKNSVIQIELDTILSGLNLSHDQFIDLCVLCGSDYTDPIRGIGILTALKLIKQHGSLETALDTIRKTTVKSTGAQKFIVPDDYPYKEAINTFKNPEVFDVSLSEVNDD